MPAAARGRRMVIPSRNDGPGEPPFAAILGAGSMVGRHLLRRLADRGFSGACFGRRPGSIPPGSPAGFARRANPGDGEPARLPAGATLFSLVPVPALPALLERLPGGGRLVALSTSGVGHWSASPDPAERARAADVLRSEDDVRRLCRDRGLACTILRPALTWDPGRDRNVTAIASFVRRYRAFPVVWPGDGLRQPIHADDVARSMIAAMDMPGARGALLDLPGPETLSYREMVRRVFRALGRRPVLLYLPAAPARLAFRAWRAASGAPYSAAALERMNADLTLDPAPARRALGVRCRPFRPAFP